MLGSGLLYQFHTTNRAFTCGFVGGFIAIAAGRAVVISFGLFFFGLCRYIICQYNNLHTYNKQKDYLFHDGNLVYAKLPSLYKLIQTVLRIIGPLWRRFS